MSPRAIIIYCGLLLTVSAVAIDIILPAFSAIADNLQAPYSQVQLVVPIFIIAAGFGQLLWGAMSDRFGRKKTLHIGLSGFVLGSLLCWLAPNIELMLAGRVVQGIFVASCAVIARAILRDMFSGKELARNMALAMMIFALGPIIAPLVGVGIMSLTSWRIILLLILLFGVSLLVVAMTFLPETIVLKNKDALKPRVLIASFHQLIQNKQSAFFLLLSGPIMAMMVFILMSLPRVFQEEYAINGALFAILFAMHGIGIIIGQFVNRWMIDKYDVFTALNIGAVILVVSAALITTLSSLHIIGPYLLTACITLFATSYLIVFANVGALTLEPHGSIAGFVSSLFGFTSQAVSALIAILFSIYAGGNVINFALCLFVQSIFVLMLLLVWRIKISNEI